MIRRGQAYPCFLTAEELTEIRRQQEEKQHNPGIYGEYAVCRKYSLEDVQARIAAGDPYVIRLRSDCSGDQSRTITVTDAIRGNITMPENNMDIVLLKANGIPTYHFAHVVDDHLMRTTHVIRGEEWLSSPPVHVELFGKMGWEHPVYCHTAHLMKTGENGGKRKLSKRKDPELSLDYYRQDGYHPDAVREYLITLLNSNFEEWRIANPELPLEDFDFSESKMSNSGALFDLDKLCDVCKDVLVKIPAPELADFMINWAEEFDKDAYSLFSADREYLIKVLDVGRSGPKPRKDLVYAKQINQFISYFYDERFTVEDDIPENVSKEDAKLILEKYMETYDHSDDQSAWFDKIREASVELGYAAKPKDFKKNPEMYKGHVGDVSTVVRLAVTGRRNSPDVWEIQQILGEQRTRDRVGSFIDNLYS